MWMIDPILHFPIVHILLWAVHGNGVSLGHGSGIITIVITYYYDLLNHKAQHMLLTLYYEIQNR